MVIGMGKKNVWNTKPLIGKKKSPGSSMKQFGGAVLSKMKGK